MNRLPYPGLRAFEHDEADLFFGRDHAIDQMIDKLAETRFLSVLGSSGSGKSSLVRTGLLDGLELGLHPSGTRWSICTFMPGGTPFANLAQELMNLQALPDGSTEPPDKEDNILQLMLQEGPRSLIQWCMDGYLPPSTNLLLLVDQFEELFRFGGYSAKEEAEAFVKLLIESVGSDEAPIHVVMTMRSEYLGACALIPGLAEIINRGTFLTPRMSRQNCREAIVGPAALVGSRIEDALVTRLLNDMMTFAPWEAERGVNRVKSLSRRADQLPMMQHVLNRLWRESTETNCMTVEGYERLGGLNGALDAHGEELLAMFTDEERKLVTAVFQNLVEGQSTETATRRPMRLCHLIEATSAEPTMIRKILDVFRADDCSFVRPGPRIPLTDDTIVDISHESLIRQWSQLSQWVADEARAAEFWYRLSAANSRFRSNEGGLLHELDLANLSSWWHAARPNRVWARRYSDDFDSVAAYLQESEQRSREEVEVETEREQRHQRRLFIALGAVSGLAIMASLAAWWGYYQQQTVKVVKQVTVVAAGAAENLAEGLFRRMDEGLKIPVATLYPLILDREYALENMSGSVVSGNELNLKRIQLLIRSAGRLLDSQWIDDAAKRASMLEALALEGDITGLTDKEELSVLLIKGDVLYYQSRYFEAESYFARAESLLDNSLRDESAISDASLWESRSRIIRRRYQIANSSLRIDETVSWAKKISALAEELRTTHPMLISDENESLTTTDGAMRRAAAQVLRDRIYVTFSALSGVYHTLEYSERSLVDPKALTVSLKRDFDGLNLLTKDSTELRNIAGVEYLNGLARFERTVKSDHSSAFETASDAVSLAQVLLNEDPESNSLSLLLIDALYQRALAAVGQSNIGQVRADRNAIGSLVLAWGLRDRSTALTQFKVTMSANWLDHEVSKAVKSSGAREAARMRRLLDIALETFDESQEQLVGTALWTTLVAFRAAFDKEQNSEKLLELANLSLKGMDPDNLSDDTLIHHLIFRSYIFNEFAQKNPAIFGRETWTDLMEQGVAEANRLLEVSPYSSTALKTQEFLVGSLARHGGAPVEARRRLYLDSLALILELSRGKADSLVSVRNGAVYARESVKLSDGSQEAAKAIERISDFIEEITGDPELRKAFYDNESYLEELTQESDNAANRLAENGGADELAQAEQLRALSESIRGHIDAVTKDAEALLSTGTRQASLGGMAAQSVDVPDLRTLSSIDADVENIGRMNWTYLPAYQGNWRTLDRIETDMLFSDMPHLLSYAEIERNNVFYVRETPLPFYDNGRLIEIEAVRDDNTMLLSFLVFPELQFSLEGDSPPIYEANSKIGVKLNERSEVAAYLRFFNVFVGGEEGAFRIVESVDEMLWEPEVGSDAINSTKLLVRPLTIWPDPEKDKHWLATATIQYSNAVFHAKFRIQPSGMVKMLKYVPVAADLPLKTFRISDLRSGLTVRPGLKLLDVSSLGLEPVVTLEDELNVLKMKALATDDANTLAVLDHYVALVSDTSVQTSHNLDAEKLNGFAYELIREDVRAEALTEMLAADYATNPDDFKLGGTVGLGYLRTQRMDDAVATLEYVTSVDAEKQAPDKLRAEVWALLANAYRQKGRFVDADIALRKAESFVAEPYWSNFISAERRELAAGGETSR